MKSKPQLNFQTSIQLAGRIRADARKFNVTIDGLMTVIVKDFFAAWSVTERGKFYAHLKNRTAGRKIRSAT